MLMCVLLYYYNLLRPFILFLMFRLQEKLKHLFNNLKLMNNVMGIRCLGLFTVGVPKKGKRTPRLLWDYFLQITFILNKFKLKKLNSPI